MSLKKKDALAPASDEVRPADTRVGQGRCPQCGSNKARLVSRRERGDEFFTIRAPRQCESCNTVYYPRANLALSMAVATGGFALAAAGLFWGVAPEVGHLWSSGSDLKSWFNLVLEACGTSGAACVGYIGLRSARKTSPGIGR